MEEKMIKKTKKAKFLASFPKGYVGCANDIALIDSPKQKLWKKQRKDRGFDDTEIWNLDTSMFLWLYPRLEAILKINKDLFTKSNWQPIEKLYNFLTPWYQSCLKTGLCTDLDTDTATKLLSKALPKMWN
jgi:hypothetical protein